MPDKLDILTNELEQVFMQSGGWRECRHILGKFMEAKTTDTERWDFIERTYANVIRAGGGWRCTPASHAGTAGDTPRSAVDDAMNEEKTP